MAIKVSVVVPAYCPGEGIDRVIGSLDKQTLPANEFEVIIIDDGSPDDTFAHLERIRDAHSNVLIKRIENSGWASRPRNVGIDMARGEYVLFMDHDDYLHPDGLRSSYNYAALNGADVLSPKESKSHDVSWGMGNFTGNVPNARESRGIASLFPMMPHKFYRREFLNEHAIRFPEGRRMLWEDIYFNVEAYRYSSVISVFSEKPVYRWVQTKANNSATYGPDDEEFWDRLTRLFAFLVDALPGEEFAAARETMLVQMYRTRVLGRFNDFLAAGDATALPMVLEKVDYILAEYVPAHLEGQLGKLIQARAFLLRAGRIDLMRELREFDAGVVGISRTDNVRWVDGRLVIDAVTRWALEGQKALLLEERDGRIVRRLTPELEAALPPQLLDVTDDVVRAKSGITARSRADLVTWALSTQTDLALEGDDHRRDVVVKSETSVDIDTAVFGKPLADPVWDFHARNSLLGTANHRALRAQVTAQCALINGRAAIAYQNKNGMLSLDLGQTLRSVVTDGRAATDRATFKQLPRRLVAFTLPLEGVHVSGTTKLPGTVSFRLLHGRIARVLSSDRVARIPRIGPLLSRALGGKPAVLEGGKDGAFLTGVFRALPGTYTLMCRFGSRTAVTRIRLRVSLSGRKEFLPPSA